MLAEKQPSAGARRPRGRPKSEERAGIESHLLDVALKEFLTHGYAGTSMAGIIKAAGISKTTLYSRYPSKEELFRAIILQQTERLSAVTTLREHGSGTSLRAGLRAFANRTLQISLEGDLLQVNRLIYSESSRFPTIGAAAAERTRLGIAQVAAFVRECADRGSVILVDADAFATVFISTLRGWYIDVMLANRRVSAAARERWVEVVLDVLLQGCSDRA